MYYIMKFKNSTYFYLSSGNSTANNQTHQDKGIHTGKECDSTTVRETTRCDIKVWRYRCIFI